MQKLGVIKNILGGEVVAVDKSGNERVLKVGDSIFEGETIKANGSTKAVIAANDGKEVSLQNGESLSLDKEANALSDNPEIASIQKALLNGANITDLEETAAGGNPAGGNATGDGVSLGAASFAEGGHYSNINENYRNLTDANRAFQTPENSIGGYNDAGTDADTTTPISPATPVTPSTPVTPPTPSTPSTPGVTVTPGTPSPANPPVITPRPGAVEITTSIDPAASEVRESGAGANGEGGHYLVYKLGLSGTPVSPSGETTDLGLNFLGGTRGEDYSSVVEYSTDNGATFQPLSGYTITGVNIEDISKVQVRIKVLDDNGQDTTKGPLHHNQNEGENTGPQGMTIDNVQKTDMVDNFAVFKEGVKLSVTPSSSYLLPTTNANMTEGKIIDNDDNIELNKDIKGNIANYTNLNTNDGDDTVSIKANLENLHLNTGSGNDVVNFDKEVTISGTANSGSNANSTSIDLYSGDDVVNINADLTMNKASINLGATTNDPSYNAHDASGTNELNINANITGVGSDWRNKNTVSMGDGDDTVNFKDGVKVEKVFINMNAGENTAKGSHVTLEDVRLDTATSYTKAGETSNVEFSDSTFRNVEINFGVNTAADVNLGVQNVKLTNIIGDHVTANAQDHLEVKGGSYTGGANYFSSKDIVIDDITVDQASIGSFSGVSSVANISNLTATNRVGLRYGDGDDTINLNGGNILSKADASSYADIDTGKGNDTINFNGENKSGGLSIDTADGNDTITFGAGTTLGGTYTSSDNNLVSHYVGVRMGAGDDTLNIDKGAVLKNAGIEMGDGNDVVNLNGGLEKAGGGMYSPGVSAINLGSGDDIIHIGKDAVVNDDAMSFRGGSGHLERDGIIIQGGAGTDTLDLAGNIDFSKVAGFEKLTLGGSANNVTLNLTLDDVLNITNGNGTNRTLRIDGENGDQVDMSAFSKGGVNSEGYTEYSATSNGTTFTIEIKDEIVLHS
ncbi:retention module-containing protein [Campylobacter concisus]|uniref:retention module-containing protein n=1 Tax=Campylobacter concisus TaxID=199 RepID=UPI00131BF188|nr:retention module-containing protein [Campylobacter concisus]